MMTPKKPQRMDAYLRVSRTGTRDVESESYQTERVQRQKIEAWAKAKGVELVGEQLDRDVSGGRPFADRPGGRALMQRIRARETEGVIVATLDRFSRGGVGSALATIDAIHEAGGQVVALDFPQIDPTDEMGEAFLTIFLALGRMERRRYARRWSESRGDAIARGVPIGTPPIGYHVQHDADGRRIGLVKDTDTAWIVEVAFHTSANHGLGAAVQMLREHLPERNWTPSAVRDLLGSRTYVGELRHGEHVKPEAHEPIIDVKTWTLAQHPGKALSQSAQYPLSKVVRCGSCGEPMIGAKIGTDRRAYRCIASRRGIKCNAPGIASADNLERLLRAELLKRPKSRTDPAAELERSHAALDAAEAGLVKWAGDLKLPEKLGAAAYQAGLLARARARDEAADALKGALEVLPREGADDLGAQVARAWKRVLIRKGRQPLAERVVFEPL